MKTKLNLLKEIFLFSLPIITGQIGQMLFGMGDIVVASRFSSLAVASIGVAAMIFAPFLMVGIGVLLCTGPLASQIKGEGHEDPTLLSNAYIVSLFLSFFLILILYFNSFWLKQLGLNSEIEPHVSDYLRICSFSLLPALLFQATKEYLQAMGKTYIPNAIILCFNVINILLNVFFMFGWREFDGYGIKGAAIATLICRTLMAAVVFVYMKHVCRFVMKKNSKTIKTIFRLGSPIAFTLLCEVLVFAVVTIMVGGMSLVASASQSLVINITSLTFMVPLAIGSAVSVLVGEQFGKKSLRGIVSYSLGALALATIIQLFFAALYLLFPAAVLSTVTVDPVIIAYAGGLLFWVGVFQIPDGIQVVLSGVMRGLNETKIPMFLGLLSYWAIGLPVGVFFTYKQGLEARGLWMGLAIGLTCMCLMLIIFYKNRIKKLSRLMNS